jgi:hypothetical protein
MENKRITSSPLFGSATPQQVRDIQSEIDAYTARLVKNTTEARKVLEAIGGLPDPAREKPHD